MAQQKNEYGLSAYLAGAFYKKDMLPKAPNRRTALFTLNCCSIL